VHAASGGRRARGRGTDSLKIPWFWVRWLHSWAASVQVAQAKPESMPPVMRRLDSQHPFVTARTKIIFLMKVSDVLDFDAMAR
jgi:hypothetical protein